MTLELIPGTGEEMEPIGGATIATTWAEVRDQYTQRFGEAPQYVDDTDIGHAFAQHPAAVLRELERVRQDRDAGKVYKPWRALAGTLERLARDNTPRTVKPKAELCPGCGIRTERGIHAASCPNLHANGCACASLAPLESCNCGIVTVTLTEAAA